VNACGERVEASGWQRENPPTEPAREQRIRKPGAGRKRLEDVQPGLVKALDALIDPSTRGDPESPLRWTCKSTRRLATELTEQGYPVSATKVAELLAADGYSLQANSKTREGSQHPDRNAQFERINRQVKTFQAKGQPVVSVDTKKKELVGDFKAVGREWQRVGEPVPVRVHDFLDKELGKAIPYGVYDLLRNEGWVNVGVDHDTAEFAVESLRRWWLRMGQPTYPNATAILINADGGGSNGARVRLWKLELQRLADALGLGLHVRHFPPGTSKWNKIEHRMFCHITENWRGQPLLSRMAVVELIAATSTEQGLTIQAEMDDGTYETGRKVTDEEMASLAIERCDFHGEWNYQLSPR